MEFCKWNHCIGAVLGLLAIGSAQADGNLPPVDSFLTTIIDKSVIAGSIEKDAGGNMAFDENGNLKFNYSGKVYSVDTGDNSGQLTNLEHAIGTIQGQAAFPMSFAQLAMGMKAYLDGGPKPDMSQMPPVIHWTCNTCTMQVNGTTYRSIADMKGIFPDASIEAMRMQGRAFTGLGPVEVGRLSAQSMSVRMAGCSAVVAVSGPNANKMGTLCLNGTFTFDLSGINLNDPMKSNIVGSGTSNCVMVLHTPIRM